MATALTPSHPLHSPAEPTLSWADQLRSRAHAWRIVWDNRRHRPRSYREIPAGWLEGLSAETQARIRQLQARYHVAFEQHLNRPNALENYVYLDLMAQLFKASQGQAEIRINASTLLDIGSKNFYYARALTAAFQPRKMAGIEIEGYRRYSDGYCRHDYAIHYLDGLRGASYHVADMRDWHGSAEVVSCWYPFVHPQTLLKWGLPLSQFDPATFFRQLGNLVEPGGHLLMVNQGVEEWQMARQWLSPRALSLQRYLVVDAPLLPRPASPVLSWWQRQA